MMGLYLGLSEKAKVFVSGEKIIVCMQYVTQILPNGKKVKGPTEPSFIQCVKKEPGKFIEGSDLSLNSYTFSDDQIFKEAIQEERTRTIFFVQSSSVYFTALKDDRGKWVKRFLWSKKEIDEVMKKFK